MNLKIQYSLGFSHVSDFAAGSFSSCTKVCQGPRIPMSLLQRLDREDLSVLDDLNGNTLPHPARTRQRRDLRKLLI
jgi:hypothetical protein